MKGGIFEDSSVIAGKELTQLANRGRFHLEKAFFAAVVSSIFIFAAFVLGGDVESIEEMAEFGRMTFFILSVLAGILLPVFAIGASSGIIYSERIGKRLDVLRITPLALSNIILGKGAAILVKSLLVLGLLAPVVAATQFYGGVSVGDVAKAFLIIVSTLVLFTSIGLVVSAGATSNLDRFARSIMWLVAWGFLSSVFSGGAVALMRFILGSAGGGAALNAWSDLVACPLAVSAPGAWALLVESRLPWVASIFGFAFNVSVAVGLFALSLRSLRKNVARENEMAAEPKVKDFFAGFRRFRGGSKKVKAKARQREWVSTLVGGAVVQTSMLPVVLPLALAVPPFFAMALIAISRRSIQYDRGETMMLLATALAVVVMLMVAVQAAASIAQEKQRHTAEVIATTPAGAKMLWWKGAAIVLTQSVAIALCIVLLTSRGGSRVGGVAIAARLFGVASMFVLAWALGLSFSVAAKTPFGAGGLYAVSVLVLAPYVYYFLPEYVWDVTRWLWYGERGLAQYASQLIVVALLAAGAVVSALRQRFVRPAGVALAIGVALVIGLGAWLLAFLLPQYHRSQLEFVEIMFLPLWEPRNLQPGSIFILGVCELAFATLLLAGAHFRFTPQLLHGSRSKE